MKKNKVHGQLYKMSKVKSSQEFGKVKETRSLVEGCHGSNQVRCPTKHREASRVSASEMSGVIMHVYCRNFFIIYLLL